MPVAQPPGNSVLALNCVSGVVSCPGPGCILPPVQPLAEGCPPQHGAEAALLRGGSPGVGAAPGQSLTPVAPEGRPVGLRSVPLAGSSPVNVAGGACLGAATRTCWAQLPGKGETPNAWALSPSCQTLPGPACPRTRPLALPSCGLFKATERLLGAGGLVPGSVQEACGGLARDGLGTGKEPRRG